MALTAAHTAPLIALIAGILILIMPGLLNYIVAIYLIAVGLLGLNGIYHFTAVRLTPMWVLERTDLAGACCRKWVVSI